MYQGIISNFRLTGQGIAPFKRIEPARGSFRRVVVDVVADTKSPARRAQMMTFTASSSSARISESETAVRSSWLMALSLSGRFIVTMPISPSVS
jgi:hypothetical protein